ncbi:hypothetical protein [Robiginitomaculum antarcticum]|uniref:hypothetical protein n=1 Tax=Robiginitomaculum antarcticum TaxID=437507 RepID=UPI00037F2D2F|nr:hypothetical protein [Robiginitomaculum antarcticum]
MTTYIRVSNMQNARPAGLMQRIGRTALLIMGAIVGLGLLLVTASAALFVVLAIAFLAVIAFAGFWIRAKIFGKTVREKAFEDLEKKFGARQAHFSAPESDVADGDEIVLDARKTPDGWTVGQ